MQNILNDRLKRSFNGPQNEALFCRTRERNAFSWLRQRNLSQDEERFYSIKVVLVEELTKYEFARIIGARSLQLSLGAPPLIKKPEPAMTFFDLAQKEFEEEVLPLTVLRK